MSLSWFIFARFIPELYELLKIHNKVSRLKMNVSSYYTEFENKN